MKNKKCSKCNKIKDLSDFYAYRADCKNCNRKRKSQYLSTEIGFMNSLYYRINHSQFNEKKGRQNKCYISREHFFNLWKKHKTLYGMKCYYLGIDINFEKHSNGQRLNQVSVDRIDSEKDYVLDNIVFCSALANHIKGHCNLTVAKKMIKLSKEKPYEKSDR